MQVRLDAIRVEQRSRKTFGDIQALATSIREIGLLHPPVVTPGLRLVAGERRLKAMAALGWTEAEVRVAAGLQDAALLARAELEENTCRKDLDGEEIVLQGWRVKDAFAAQAAERKREHGGTAPGKPANTDGKFPVVKQQTRDAVGAVVGVSGRTWEKAEAVVLAAQAEPEKYGKFVAQLRTSGKVDRAYKGVKQQKRKDANAALATALPDVGERYRLMCCDLLAADIAPDSVDCIVTDPPYPEEFLPCYGKLAELAARVLKPGGSLLAMAGHMYLPRVMAELEREGLAYHWTLAYMVPGQSARVWVRRVMQEWKPVLWFVKGEYAGPTVGDAVKSEVRDKGHHHWGQSESGMAALVEKFTRPGDVVLDPFLGGGTTGIAALKLDRRFVGVDVDAECIVTTKARIAKWQEAA